jgi:hypothetical protein
VQVAIGIATQAQTACSDCRAEAKYVSLCEHTAGQNAVMNIVDTRAGRVTDRNGLQHTSIYPRIVPELRRGQYVFTRCACGSHCGAQACTSQMDIEM